jgi:hypothetical protein
LGVNLLLKLAVFVLESGQFSFLRPGHVAHHSFHYLPALSAAEDAAGSGNGRSYEHVHGTACQRVRSLGVPLAAPGAQFLIQQTATEVNAVKRKLLHCLGELEG